METYMNSSEYIEDVAKSKLGLAYENEIIFKEKEE
jgi:cell division protein DivIC